eukprot:CAMPEP_0184452778 /NCGR_PEP_ID=MMETSP0740-20130409/14483_1 /TAXON_ID=385413 /ORGANISM="Thalassiosira miniscula, Strain CCMP1093" /LENGTH=53 /DNA_ID=CAMNT_0026823803 /DNA_START=131 /DNA_END=293 /DNA_ORIENTATION=+
MTHHTGDHNGTDEGGDIGQRVAGVGWAPGLIGLVFAAFIQGLASVMYQIEPTT